MSAKNIDVNELIGLLNAQIAAQNLELHIARLQVTQLEKEVNELTKRLGSVSGETVTKSKTR